MVVISVGADTFFEGRPVREENKSSVVRSLKPVALSLALCSKLFF
jgi:hypothetical protein